MCALYMLVAEASARTSELALAKCGRWPMFWVITGMNNTLEKQMNHAKFATAQDPGRLRDTRNQRVASLYRG